MNARKLGLVTTLLGCGLAGPASAMYIDLGTSLVEFDAASFVNFNGSFSIGQDSLTLYPGTSIAVPESGGSATLDYAASFHFAAKPGYSITGFTLQGSGHGVEGSWSSASISGSFNAAGNGPWQQSSTLAPLADISLSGTLSVSSTPMEWNVWEQIGTEWGVIGGHEETTYSYEFVGYDTIHGPIPYWTVVGVDGDGDPVYGWQCCTEGVIEVREVWNYVPHTEWVTDYGDVPVFGEVTYQQGSPASMSLDAVTITASTVPLPTSVYLLGSALGLCGALRRRRS